MQAPGTHSALSIGEPWMWGAFIAFVLAMLALDLFVLGGRKAHRVGVREAAAWSAVWVSLALLFNAGLWWHLKGTVGPEIADQKALEFLTGYLIEKSLSVDNVFVFLLIFTSFHVAPEYQRRVLIYGVLGAIVLRAIMILAGAWAVREFSWVLYVFGAFLVVTGIRMLVMAEKEPDLEKNPVLRLARRHLRISDAYHGEKFTVVKDGVRYFTPLFLVLINERIREELRNGSTPQAAISAGYERAWGTILDANITTLIAGISLFWLGSGPVRGFAVVLCLGILTSMFSAVTVSRAMANLTYGRQARLTKLSI